jgi:hypothetical protein
MATKKAISKKSTPKTSAFTKVQPLEVLAIILALFFMYYVTSSTQDLLLGSGRTKDSVIAAPYMLGFVFAVLIVAYYLERQKILSVLSVMILTVLAVSGYFWIFALRTT